MNREKLGFFGRIKHIIKFHITDIFKKFKEESEDNASMHDVDLQLFKKNLPQLTHELIETYKNERKKKQVSREEMKKFVKDSLVEVKEALVYPDEASKDEMEEFFDDFLADFDDEFDGLSDEEFDMVLGEEDEDITIISESDKVKIESMVMTYILCSLPQDIKQQAEQAILQVVNTEIDNQHRDYSQVSFISDVIENTKDVMPSGPVAGLELTLALEEPSSVVFPNLTADKIKQVYTSFGNYDFIRETLDKYIAVVEPMLSNEIASFIEYIVMNNNELSNIASGLNLVNPYDVFVIAITASIIPEDEILNKIGG